MPRIQLPASLANVSVCLIVTSQLSYPGVYPGDRSTATPALAPASAPAPGPAHAEVRYSRSYIYTLQICIVDNYCGLHEARADAFVGNLAFATNRLTCNCAFCCSPHRLLQAPAMLNRTRMRATILTLSVDRLTFCGGLRAGTSHIWCMAGSEGGDNIESKLLLTNNIQSQFSQKIVQVKDHY